ncbi:MAG: acriflavin resistance protein, partial [Acidobacteria bacterium]|nr:acriflavin resistance protein [Acidobacteriota bacterium]
FLPIGFMSGIVGRFMKSFGLTMAFAVMVSLLVSFTLTPMLGARWLKVRREEGDAAHPAHTSRESGWFGPLDRGYTRTLEWALSHRKAVALTALLVFLSSVPLFMIVNKNFMPLDDQSEFEIGLRAPEGTSLQSTELIANRVATRLRASYPEVAFTMVTVADDSARTANVATIYVRLLPLGERDRDVFAVADAVRKELKAQYASSGLRAAVRPLGMMAGGGQQSAEIQFVLNGPDIAKLQEYAQNVAAETRDVPGAVDVDISLNPGKPELEVTLDRAKAADLGVQIGDAAEAMRLLVGGDQVTTYNEGDEQYEVHVRAMPDYRRTVADVGGLTVASSRLGSVALDNIASFEPGSAPAEIQRLNRARQVTVYASLLPGVGQTNVMDAMQASASRLNLGPEYFTRFAGRSRELRRTGQAFLLAFGLSLVFMYMILAAQFESWLHPITILLSLPLTLPFALVSIIVAGQSLNVMSGLGLLVLFGVVKKNSILQIDRANQLREHGMSTHEAVVQASRDRFRPILMTTLSFVAGMVPLVLSSGVGSGTNRAIGFVIIGGQTLVLVLTLVVTPVAYSMFDDASKVGVWGRVYEWAVRVAGRLAARVRPAGATGAGLLLALLLGAPAYGQALAQKGGPPAPAASDAPLLRLTLDDAVRLGLENNMDLKVDRLDPQIAMERVGQAESVFLPALASSLTRNSALAPPTSFLVGNQGVQSTTGTGAISVSQRLPHFGTSYATGWDTTRSKSTSQFSNYNPILTSRIQFTVSQPLLRDLTIDAGRQQLIVSKRNHQISDTRFRETVVRTLSDVKKAYWDLVAARALVEVQQRSLELARELVRINKARVDVGQAPPLDLVTAQAEEAQRDENLTIAQVTLKQAEDRLRMLVLDPDNQGFWTTAIDPTDRPTLLGGVPDVESVIDRALKQRLDLVRARAELENVRTNVRFYKNQTLPDVRFQVNFQSAGLGGTRLIRTGGFPGTVVGSEPVSFGYVMDQVFRSAYPTWIVGVNVTYPLGRSADEASLARSRIEEAQARARLQTSELKAVRQLRQSAWQVDMNARRINTSRAGRALAEQRLEAEQKRFEVGMSTTFLVVQAQRDLAQARNNELQAALEYVKAVIEFETLQEAGPAAGTTTGASTATMTVSGSTVSGSTAALQPAASAMAIR